MDIISDTKKVREQVSGWKNENQTVALVPTMGNLHAGHMALVEQARKQADRVVVSLFVNPLQFNQTEDLKTYPSTFEHDVQLLTKAGTDCLFNPGVKDVYPQPLDSMTKVLVTGLIETLEGKHRPGHLEGVATVVLKLFNMVQPDTSYFGEKDYQQLLLIRKMVSDLSLPIDVRAQKTIRDSDGLAMSSRNNNLSPETRKKAPQIFAQLSSVAKLIKTGSHDYQRLETESIKELCDAGFSVDYLKVCDINSLKPAQQKDQNLIIVTAASLGQVRLIDNLNLQL